MRSNVDPLEPRESAFPDTYHKLVYWLDEHPLADYTKALKAQERKVHKAKNQPCEALYPRREVVTVAPDVWSRRCLRQGSWYRNSPFRGQYLLVSSNPVEGILPWARVSIREFQPLRLADVSHVIDLLTDPVLCEQIPPGWGLFTEWEVQAIEHYLQSQKISMSIQELFCYYTANHVNFLSPRLFLEEDGMIIPYSIQAPDIVCSACVELFGVIGKGFRKKYVAPCPGLKYVELPQGSYFCVEMDHPIDGPVPPMKRP